MLLRLVVVGGCALGAFAARGTAVVSKFGGELSLGSLTLGGEVKVVASLGSVGPAARGAALGAFGATGVSDDAAPMCAVSAGEALILDCGDASTPPVEFAAFAASCADCVVLSAWRGDLGRCVSSNSDALAALADGCKSRGRRVSLVVVAHDCPVEELAALSAAVETEVRGSAGGDAFSAVTAVSASGDVAAAVNAALLRATPRSSATVGAELAALWAQTRPVVTAADVAAHACDVACEQRLAQAELVFAPWRRSVDEGKLAPKGWAVEAASLYRSALASFDASTRLFWRAGDARSKKRAELESALRSEVTRCHALQLASASQRRLRQLRSRLAKACAAEGVVSAQDSSELVQRAEFDFDLDATRCDVQALALDATPARAAFVDAATRCARDFSESATARLLAAKAEERRAAKATKAATREAAKTQGKTSKPAARTKPRGVQCALQLVGMLRPRGFGNLQGFASYALGPHSLLFGFSDDRDANQGDMQGADDYPLLRLQPKVTLDVDL